MTAYDLNTGTIRWKIPLGVVPELAAKGFTGTGSQFPKVSPVLTAGGVIFTGTRDRKVRAIDSDTGEVLWEAEVDAALEPIGQRLLLALGRDVHDRAAIDHRHALVELAQLRVRRPVVTDAGALHFERVIGIEPQRIATRGQRIDGAVVSDGIGGGGIGGGRGGVDGAGCEGRRGEE